jgi:hypothetical protein
MAGGGGMQSAGYTFNPGAQNPSGQGGGGQGNPLAAMQPALTFNPNAANPSGQGGSWVGGQATPMPMQQNQQVGQLMQLIQMLRGGWL